MLKYYYKIYIWIRFRRLVMKMIILGAYDLRESCSFLQKAVKNTTKMEKFSDRAKKKSKYLYLSK
jgi:hypothetical protein